MTEPEQDAGAKRWDVVVLNVTTATVLGAGLQVWVSYHTDWLNLYGAVVGYVVWFAALFLSYLSKGEKNSLLGMPRALLFFQPLSVIVLTAIALLCVIGSFFGSLKIMPIANVGRVRVTSEDDLARLDTVRPYEVPEDGDETHLRRIEMSPLPVRLVAKADGFPIRRFVLEPWQRQQINSDFFWGERVLFFLPTKRFTDFIPANPQDNDTILVISLVTPSAGKKHTEVIKFDNYDGRPLVVGPVEKGIAIPANLMKEWEQSDSFVKSWLKPAIRPELNRFLAPDADFEVELQYKTSSTSITTSVVDRSQTRENASKWNLPNWRWKVIDYVPPE